MIKNYVTLDNNNRLPSNHETRWVGDVGRDKELKARSGSSGCSAIINSSNPDPV